MSMRGVVTKWFDDPARGYGFIKGFDGESYFVHFSEVWMRAKHKYLVPGEKVTFDPMVTERGNRAVAVRPDREKE